MGKSFLKPRKMYAMYFAASSLLLMLAIVFNERVMLGWIASINFLICLTMGVVMPSKK
jgi:hypothetical membrane protein